MKPLHRLLERQIRRHLGSELSIPEEMTSFIEAVNQAYIQNDIDRAMVERSLELSSQELLHSNAEMRAVFQAMPDQYFRIDKDGRILDYKTPNIKGIDVLKVSRPNASLGDLLPAGIWTTLQDNVAHAIELQTMITLESPLRLNGSGFLCEARLVPIFKKQVIIILRDITEREKAVTSLKEREGRFSALIQQSTNVFSILDADGLMIYNSPSAENIFGYAMDYLIAKSPFDFIHADDRDHVYAEFTKILNNKKNRKPVEYRFLKGDGSWHYLESTGSNLLDQPGINGIVITSRDITVRKQAELEKEKLHDQLLHAQKMEAIGTLAGGVAHDFNNLLMGIQGYASLALHELQIGSPGYERLNGIEGQVKKGADLTRQLLGFARGGKYEVKSTQLNELIINTAEMFGRTKKEITLEMNLQQDCWTADIDRGQIEQTLLNIFINAWQAMPGGGDLYLETNNICLDEHVAAPCAIAAGKYVRISITDTGTGMDDATRQRIFEPFFTTKAIGLGTGLGLASAYGIIKNHGGFIDVESTMGEGSTFRIYLPASGNGVSEDARSDEQVMSGHETILLVDDEEVNLLILKELLEATGYKVFLAGSGQEAIATYMSKKDQIDVVIMDMIMPGIGGNKAFQTLRDINPAVKVILCSGYSIDGEAEMIMAKGCNGFIQKPFKIESLTRKIREALAKSA